MARTIVNTKKEYLIAIKTAEMFNGRLVAGGFIDHTRWVASKCHSDNHVQWSIGLPTSTENKDINADLCIAVCRHLLRNSETLQNLLPQEKTNVITNTNHKRVSRRNSTQTASA